jgi:hypothetical protein
MATLTYTKTDIINLVDRLSSRADSIMLADMPKLCSDMRAAAKLLKVMLDSGTPATTITIENDNGGR